MGLNMNANASGTYDTEFRVTSPNNNDLLIEGVTVNAPTPTTTTMHYQDSNGYSYVPKRTSPTTEELVSAGAFSNNFNYPRVYPNSNSISWTVVAFGYHNGTNYWAQGMAGPTSITIAGAGLYQFNAILPVSTNGTAAGGWVCFGVNGSRYFNPYGLSTHQQQLHGVASQHAYNNSPSTSSLPYHTTTVSQVLDLTDNDYVQVFIQAKNYSSGGRVAVDGRSAALNWCLIGNTRF